MGGNEDTMEIGTQYFQIISAGLVFQAVTAGVTASLRELVKQRYLCYTI